jgi:hypothetical protein
MISATVLKSLQVLATTHPTAFTVTPADIALGYVDIAQPSLLDIKTNSQDGVALEFHGVDSGADIQSIVVTGGANGFSMPASGGIMLLQGAWQPTVARKIRLNYRVKLGPHTQVGSYVWPLSMRVSPL